LVKYSDAGARRGKYREDIPRPTRKPCVSRSCHIDLLKDARVNPIESINLPDNVMVLFVNKRNYQDPAWPCNGIRR